MTYFDIVGKVKEAVLSPMLYVITFVSGTDNAKVLAEDWLSVNEPTVEPLSVRVMVEF